MKKTALVSILAIVAVLAVAGCTQVNNVQVGIQGTTPIKAITDNPDLYVGSSVKIYGRYGAVSFGLTDDEGYVVYFDANCLKNRAFEAGRSYTVQGVLMKESQDILGRTTYKYKIDCEAEATA
jgi:starvation-inducible outer membrane lipoprotein